MKSSRPMAAAVAAVAAIVFLSACNGKEAVSEQTPVKNEIPVGVRELSRSSFTEYGEYFGRTEASANAILTAPAGGRVQDLRAAEGDAVRAGQSLGSVNLERVQAAYDAAVLNERIAEDMFRNQQKFYKDGNVSRLAMDQAELAWRSAQNARIDAGTTLEGAKCQSPLNGIVLSRKVELHDELPPGGATFSVGDISSLMVRIGLPEADIAGVKTGTPAKVSFSAYPGETWMGVLERIEREPSERSLSYEAVVRLNNADHRLLPGSTAKVTLPRKTYEAAIVVPTETILSSAGGSFAMVARKEGDAWVARMVSVRRGASDGSSTLILEGLSAGDRLISEGGHLVKDGSSVAIEGRLALAESK